MLNTEYYARRPLTLARPFHGFSHSICSPRPLFLMCHHDLERHENRICSILSSPGVLHLASPRVEYGLIRQNQHFIGTFGPKEEISSVIQQPNNRWRFRSSTETDGDDNTVRTERGRVLQLFAPLR